MKLSEKHQEILETIYPDGYPIPEGDVTDNMCEAHYFHVMYVDIVKDGNWSRGVPVIHKYNPVEWQKTLSIINDPQGPGIIITGHKEYSVLYDPTKVKGKAEVTAETEEVKAEVKPEVKKPMGRPPQKKSK